MLSERMTSLVKKAADEFERGADPFENWWLAENDVTLDECMALSSYVSIALRYFSSVPSKHQAMIVARWSVM